jgi:hypothetical protein
MSGWCATYGHPQGPHACPPAPVPVEPDPGDEHEVWVDYDEPLTLTPKDTKRYVLVDPDEWATLRAEAADLRRRLAAVETLCDEHDAAERAWLLTTKRVRAALAVSD